MIINENIKKNLEMLYNDIDIVMRSNSLTEKQIQNFLISFERARYNVLNEIKNYNNTVEFEYEKIKTIDDEYKAELEKIDVKEKNTKVKLLKIYVPEILPSYKNIKTHTYKRILLNMSEVTKPYADLFKNEAFIFIKIFDKSSGWDVDNKNIKPVADGLILSKVIKDDNMSKMYYCVRGKFSDNPHTEIYVSDVADAKLVLEKYSQ